MKETPYQLSYYTIFSDSVNSKKDSVLFSTRSSESFLVSRKIRRLLEENEIDHLPDRIKKTLIDKKVLVKADENELLTIAKENQEASTEKNTVLYEVIQPSANCQLGCDYCGQDHRKVNISSKLYHKIVERIRAKAAKKKYQKLSIGWFGGEPLMSLRQIRELTAHFQALAREFGMEYGAKIVTNGLSLKEAIFLELVKDLKVDEIEITLDGTATFHDHRRHLKNGGKSFEIIFNNLLTIVNRPDFEELGCSLSVRCNVDKRNWEGVSPLIQHLAAHGLHKKLAYFYPIGVYSWGGNEAHKKSLTKEEFAAQEIDWLIEMIEAGFSPQILPNRQKQVCIVVSDSSEMYDAYGNIFNCTEVSYTDHYKDTAFVLGNLHKDHQDFSANRPLSDWNQTILTDRFPCHTCKMLPVCGGGCPKAWYEDMRACPSAKFNIKERLALAYVASMVEDKSFFSNLENIEEEVTPEMS